MSSERSRPTAAVPRPNPYGKWRAATLASVYLLMVVHVVHWKLAGKTLAPLELNEVMYTLELGVITAGFIFMVVAFLATAVFGRFFCSWGCHILALQDLCTWILKKLRIRPTPIRSRTLLLVPPLALFYMFGWPQVARLLVNRWPDTWGFLGPRPVFDLRIITDAEGWASFVTTDFWRNLPGPGITILTFLVCGFAIVYFLGSRSFCQYGCPYGVVFGLADRVAPGRILLTGECSKCGLCTAGCDSDIRVHEEVLRFGKVVSSRCLKDLDCVGTCPTGGLSFGYAKPAGFQSLFSKVRSRIRYDFSAGEEATIVVIWLATLVIFRGLYAHVPFLMTLGLGGVLGFLVVWTARLVRRRSLWLNGATLKISGRLTSRGKMFATGAALVGVFVVHSGFIRYHEVASERELQRAAAGGAGSEELASALAHLQTLDRWGLVEPAALKPRLASVNMAMGRFGEAESHLREIVARHSGAAEAPVRADAHELLASVRAATGDREGTIRELRAALAEDPGRVESRLNLADLLVEDGKLEEGERQLRSALGLRPESVRALYNLGVVLARSGREDEALGLLSEAARIDPAEPQVEAALRILRAERGQTSASE